MESIGSYRREARGVRGRCLFGFPGLRECAEQCQYILYATVPDSRTVAVCLDAVEQIVGDLTEPDRGILTAWELALAKGVSEMISESGAKR